MLQRLQNEHCSEVEEIHVYFTKMLQLREELAATGKTITGDHFTSILTNSLPLSVYGGVISTANMLLKMHDKMPTTRQLVEAIEEEYMRCNFAQGGSMSTPTALYASPQGQSNQKGKRKKPNRCTNPKCRYRHTHDFKDCCSEGGSQYNSNPLPTQPPPQNTQNTQGNRNPHQMMQANVAQDLEVVDPLDAVFASVTSLMTTDVTPKADRSKRIEIYDSGVTCNMSPYIEAFANFEFIMPKPISTVNNQTFEAVGKDTLCIKVPNGDAFTVLTLNYCQGHSTCQGHSCPITSTERLYTVQVSTTRRSTKTKDSNNYLDTNV